MTRPGPTLSFAGKRVLLIGACGGIGAAARTSLLDAGAVVVCADRPTALASLPDDVPGLPVELEQPGAATRVVEQAWDRDGPLDVLVHAAGIYPAVRAVETDETLFDRVLRVNAASALFAATALARLSATQGRTASVVVVSSGAAERARPGTIAYAASKAALNAVVRGLALELGPHGVRVNAIAPGFVKVDSDLNPVPAEYVEAVRAATPLGRTATADDLVPGLLWLAHDVSGWVSGHVLAVDGGAGLGSPQAPSWLPVPLTTGPEAGTSPARAARER